jgi:signal transduction histidine kinase
MISALHPSPKPSAVAQGPRTLDSLWHSRTLNPPTDPEERILWRVGLVAAASIAIATVVAVSILGAHIYTALAERSDAFGINVRIAIGLVCLAVATLLLSMTRAPRLVVGVLLGLPLLLGATTLVEHFLGIGLLSANTAVMFVFLSAGLALGLVRSPRAAVASDALIYIAIAICLLAVIAQIFGARAQYPLSAHGEMVMPTALIGLALCVGVVLQRTDRGLGKLLCSSGNGGVLARRLLPVLIVAPILVRRLTYLGVEAGVYDEMFSTSLDILVSVVILVAILASSAHTVERLDKVRRGNEAQIRHMVRDISRHAQEVQRSNRELESFSYSVSHDLRAPIRHIAGFSELLIKRSQGQLDDKSRHYLKMIMESAESAGRLIDDLLEFSRMGRAEIKAARVDLREAFDESWQKLAPERQGRDVAFEIGTLPAAHADPAMVRLISDNLLSNALKYTSRTTKPASIDVSGQLDGERVVVTVRDNGAGFDMKYVDKLFGVFQRLHGDEFEGVGIGLANVKRIVERHGGTVSGEGVVDGGAVFQFTLPAAKGESS